MYTTRLTNWSFEGFSVRRSCSGRIWFDLYFLKIKKKALDHKNPQHHSLSSPFTQQKKKKIFLISCFVILKTSRSSNKRLELKPCFRLLLPCTSIVEDKNSRYPSVRQSPMLMNLFHFRHSQPPSFFSFPPPPSLFFLCFFSPSFLFTIFFF